MTNTYIVERKHFLTQFPNCLRRQSQQIKLTIDSSFIKLSRGSFSFSESVLFAYLFTILQSYPKILGRTLSE